MSLILGKAIERVAAQFQYTSDPEGLDRWEIDNLKGDCEDFLLTVLHVLWDKPNRVAFFWRLIVKRDAEIYYVQYPHPTGKFVGHAIARVNGLWFDNGSKEPETAQAIIDRLGVSFGPRRYTRLNLIGKFVTARLTR